MRPTAQVPHLLSLWRQTANNEQWRRKIVIRLLEGAGSALGLDSNDHDAIVIASLRPTSPHATLARLCVAWLEEPGSVEFAVIANAYGMTDPVHKLAKGGRKRDAVNIRTKYLRQLVTNHPQQPAKRLHALALTEADTDESPFSANDGELFEIGTDKPVSADKFAKLLSAAKNPRKR